MRIATDSLSSLKKLRLIEQLWDELSREAESVDSPAWHAEVPADAEKAVADGRATFIECDAAKDSRRRA